jgi:hypothetical protein
MGGSSAPWDSRLPVLHRNSAVCMGMNCKLSFGCFHPIYPIIKLNYYLLTFHMKNKSEVQKKNNLHD